MEISKFVNLADGGTLSFYEHFLNKELADELFKVIEKNTPWNQETTRFGNKFPRLTMWYADPGLTYSYSGVKHESAEWPFYLTELRKRVEKITNKHFNSLLLNYYRNGSDSIGFHSDNEKELGINPMVPSISLGAERLFVIKHVKTKEVQHHKLTHGSLLVMGGTMQSFWHHGVPKTEAEIGGRINLTFRNILKSEQL